MNPLGVLCASDVMGPVTGVAQSEVGPDAMIGPLMKELGGTTSAVAVVRDGEVIGEITADSILQRLSQ